VHEGVTNGTTDEVNGELIVDGQRLLLLIPHGCDQRQRPRR